MKEGPLPAATAAAATAGCRGGGRGGRGDGSGRRRERGSARARPFQEREPGGRRSARSSAKPAAWSRLGSDRSCATPFRVTAPGKPRPSFRAAYPSPAPGGGPRRNLCACALCWRSRERKGAGSGRSLRTRQKPSPPCSLWAVRLVLLRGLLGHLNEDR